MPNPPHQNVRQIFVEVPDESAKLPPEVRDVFRNFVAAVNNRLSALADAHAASAGLKGTVGIAKQSLPDPSGQSVPALQVMDRIVIKDPNNKKAGHPLNKNDDNTVLTLGAAKDYFDCPTLVSILQNCQDSPDEAIPGQSGGCGTPAMTANTTTAIGYDPGTVAQIWVRGNFAYIVVTQGGLLSLQIYSVRPGAAPEAVSFAHIAFTGTQLKRCWLQDEYIYAIDGQRLYVCNIGGFTPTTTNPVWITSFGLP